MRLFEVLPLLRGAKRSSSGWVAFCPAHDDRQRSLSVAERDGQLLLYCHAGCGFESILATIKSSTAGRSSSTDGADDSRGKTVETTYNYRSTEGELLFQVVRYESVDEAGNKSKTFRVRRPSGPGENSGWIYNREGIPPVLYCQNQIIDEDLVFIVEGEKDVISLGSIGIAATCNPGGAGKWRSEFNELFRHKTVAIIPDNDEPGRRHAESVANELSGIAEWVSVVEVPGLGPKEDISDFIARGGTFYDVLDLFEQSERWKKGTSDTPIVGTQQNGFEFTIVSNLLEEPDEEAPYVWGATLPTGGVSICSAKPKVGKSTIARNLALAVASGEDFLGRSTVEGKVLYLALEEKRAEVRDHFRRMGAESDNILIHTGAAPFDAVECLRRAVNELKPLLVIVDPLSRFLRISDFNDYADVSRGFEPLIDLARSSHCHISLIHHDSKLDRFGGDALLGSTAFFAAVDCHIQLRKQGARRTISTTQRYGEDMEERIIELDPITGIVGDCGTLGELDLVTLRMEILRLLDEQPMTRREINEHLTDRSNGEISKALGSLAEDGVIKVEGEGKRGKPKLYSRS